jgi:hypothetical protein
VSRTKRLYRVTATYPGAPNFGVTRHYQTRRAAEHRARVLRDRYEAEPAVLVTITVSDPITWPAS